MPITPIARFATAFILALAASNASSRTEPEPEALFNGRDLTGWAAMFGGSLDAWVALDGEIRVVKPGQGGWLRTDRMFRDFELEAEFIIPPGGNSGIGLRCSSVGDPAFTGFEVQILDSHGQPVDRSQAGAVYNAIAPSAQAVKPAGEWNQYRIRVVGDTLDVWLNGVHVQQAQKLDDRGIYRNDDQPLPLNERMTTGYIAFQDHGEGGLRLRNISITDLSPDPDPGDYQFAFDGTTNGWTHRGGGSFTFEDGTLVAADGPGHLFSDATHTDIELHALVRIARPEETGAPRPGNGGIYFRTVPRPENPDTWPLGYEAQIDNHDTRATNYTGCIYDYAPARTGAPITTDGAWFDYRIRAVGERVQTFINGRPMADATLDAFDRGHIAFQTHHPGNRIEFRDVRWRVPAADE
ncbi:MAG: 3-keto-disaccharide hydrolase [Phycisphaerales bacterium]